MDWSLFPADAAPSTRFTRNGLPLHISSEYLSVESNG